MASYYVVKTSSRMLFFYRAAHYGLMYRTMENAKISQETCLLRNAGRYFSISIHNGEIHMFCQEEGGGLWLFTERDGQWNRRSLNPPADTDGMPRPTEEPSNEGPVKHVESASAAESAAYDVSVPFAESAAFGGSGPLTEQRRRDCLVTPLGNNRTKGLCLVYNTLSADGASHYLVTQQMSGNGWSPASRIDKFIPLNHALYETQATSREHMLLFYQTRTTENQLGYREVTPTRFGSYQQFHNAAGTVADTAFLTTNDTVHLLYIIKTLFSCQLFYRRRDEDHFTTPILLCEAPRIEQCLLSIVYDNLYATCLIGSQPHMAVSENKGSSFTRMTLYKSKFCYDPVKAVYLSSLPMSENECYVRQVYVDRNAPWDTQMLPDLYADFYALPEAEQAPAEAPPAPKDVVRDMQDRLAAAESQIRERDRQIFDLMLKMKS